MVGESGESGKASRLAKVGEKIWEKLQQCL